MIFKIYVVGFIVTLISIGLKFLFREEYSNAPRGSTYEKKIETFKRFFDISSIILIILFYLYNIYVFYIKYNSKISVISVMYIISISCFFIITFLDNIEFKYFDIIWIILYSISWIVFTLVCGFYIFASISVFSQGKQEAAFDEKQKYKEYSHSIEIVEMEEVPYTNVSGRRWYIRSSPSIAYYYDVITKSGNQTTKILDGYNYYVEKDESDEYKNNPHIKVYEINEKYTNLYGKEIEDFVTYEYTICVPENSIYYEK